MIAHKARPALTGLTIPRSVWRRNISPHTSGRDVDPQFEQRLRCDPFLAPGWIIPDHVGNDSPQLGRNPGATATIRFPPPEQPEALPMPADECLRLNDDEGISPGEQPRQPSQDQPRCILGSSWLGLALDEERQLPAQEQILGLEGGTRPHAYRDELKGILEQAD